MTPRGDETARALVERSAGDLRRIEKAASTLLPLEREVLIFASGQGLRNEEIARRLGLTPEAVRHILSDALCKLDRALERLERPWWRFW